MKKLKRTKIFSWSRKINSSRKLKSFADALSTGMILSSGRTKCSTKSLRFSRELRYRPSVPSSSSIRMAMAHSKEESSSKLYRLCMCSIFLPLRWMFYGIHLTMMLVAVSVTMSSFASLSALEFKIEAKMRLSFSR
jgi:hypothetical protein